jgi:hypothetical protein
MRLLPALLAAAVLGTPVGGYGQSTPVVLELYTSQGCSSCPPADALLSALAEQDGVIALALHVDYWDYLGWKDSFGKPQHTARQRNYAKAAHSRTVYTPEMVVQGQERMKGHDAAAIAGQIALHRQKRAAAELTLGRDGGALTIELAPVGPEAGASDVHVVRFIPSEAVEIEGGENAGKQVTYTNIVTSWDTIAEWDGKAAVELRYEDVGDGPVAVIVQRTEMGPVVTAAKLP